MRYAASRGSGSLPIHRRQLATRDTSALRRASYFEPQLERIARLDTPGECEALVSASGRLLAGFRHKGIYEYEDGQWTFRAAHPYPSGEGEYWAHLAADGVELSYAITGKPVVDRKISEGRDMKFIRNAPRALWVSRGPNFQQVMLAEPL